MNPLEKLANRLTLVALRAAMREFRLFRQVMKEGIDTYRQVHGLPLLYTEAEPPPEFTRSIHKGFIKDGDYMTPWVIQELAIENHIPIDAMTDLEELARSQGWVDAEGRLLALPATAGNLDAQAYQYLNLGEGVRRR